MTTTPCPTCTRLPGTLKCNRHRTESVATGILRRAQAAGYTGTNPLEAEAHLGLRPVVIG